VWVPITPSPLLTWFLALDEGTASSASGSWEPCSPALSVPHDTTIRVPGRIARVRLARLARPARPCQGRRAPHPAPSGHPCSSARSEPQDCPGPIGQSWPALARLLPVGSADCALIFSPRPLLRWRADLVQRQRAYPRRTPGRPRTAPAMQALVLEMARDNPSWTYRCIHSASDSRRSAAQSSIRAAQGCPFWPAYP